MAGFQVIMYGRFWVITEDKSEIRVFPLAFIAPGENAEAVNLPAGEAKVLDDLFERGAVQMNGQVIRLGSKVRAEFAAKVAELGHTGSVAIPMSDRTCKQALEAYDRWKAQMEARLRELAGERSADPETQTRIVRELWKLLHSSNKGA